MVGGVHSGVDGGWCALWCTQVIALMTSTLLPFSGVQWSCCRPCYLPHQPPLSASLLVQLSSEDAPVVLAQSKSCDTLAPRLLLPVTLAPHLPLPVCACLRLQP